MGYETASKKAGKVHDEFPCPHCGALLTKRRMERAWVTKNDPYIAQSSSLSPQSLSLSPQSSILRQAKQVPVLINYSVGKQRFEKTPDAFDLALIEKIEQLEIPYWFPTDRMPEGYNTEQPKVSHGITHVHHFYTKRSLWVLGALYDKAFKSRHKLSVFFVQYAALGFSKISRYVPTHFSQVNQYLSGTLYIGSQQVEVSPDYILTGKLQRLVKHEAPRFGKITVASIGCCDSSVFPIPGESFDYIFIDPPFGANLNYSELNILWEQWLKVWTNNKPEAIENSVQKKGLNEYRHLRDCFKTVGAI